MGKLIMLTPVALASLSASRGSGVENLRTPDPKEVWADSTYGTPVTIDIDFGYWRVFDTVFLGSVDAKAGATWSITGGSSYNATTFLPESPLRAPDALNQYPAVSHGLWHGDRSGAQYLRLTLNQVTNNALTAGILMVGEAFSATYGQEWGAGRKVIDTGTATPLQGGGYAVVEGARKGSYSWTFGDLSMAEVDALYGLQLDRGQTRPLLVVEDPANTAGLRNRIHYGLLASLRQFERRNPAQTRWEMTIEEWI